MDNKILTEEAKETEKEAGKEEPGKANVGPDSSRHKGLRKTQSLRPHQRPCFCIPFLIYYLQ